MSETHETLQHSPLGNEAIAWWPSEEYIRRSRLRGLIEATGNNSLAGLREWATEDVGRYWDAVVKHLDVAWTHPYGPVLTTDRGKLWARWFNGGGFNYVAIALDRHVRVANGDRTAITWEDDSGQTASLTYSELTAEVNRFANALATLGIEKGDRIGIFMPMIPETVIAVLACGKVGAVFIPLFSGYGDDAIASRLSDCEATLLITADAFPRRDKVVRMKDVADRAMQSAPTVKTCITVRRTGVTVSWDADRDRWWHDAVADQPAHFNTVETDANDPYMIIYTSGTTGRPKGTVHVHAGFPIKAAHDLAYCFDLHPDDRLLWVSDLGWMMGPWMIAGTLMLGATLILHEGTPDYPSPDRLWHSVERQGTTVLGISPTVIRALKAHGEEWPRQHDLSSLRILGSTGETWDPESWHWFFQEVGHEQCPIINYSGGTETGGGILGCFTIEPIKSCAFTGPVPGMIADVVDPDGSPIRNAVGELIIREPWVGMTQGFWNDPERYIETYWSRFPGLWVHGDWTEIDEDGYWYIRGRSDDVIKVAGKRVGPGEVESAAAFHPGLQECVAVGVPDDVKGEAVHIFAVLVPGYEPTQDVALSIRETVRNHLGPALQPDAVHVVHDLPKTRNGKIMRRVVRAAFLGASPGEITALENPAVIDEIAGHGKSFRTRLRT